MEAKVQLRIRNNGELIGTWQGTGEATWQASYHLARNIPEGRRRAGILAAKLALQDAIYNLTTNPTHVKDH